MKNFLTALFVFFICSEHALAVELCDVYSSSYNPFPCTSHIGDGNCTWWAASKRPDLKAVMNHHAKYWLTDALGYDYAIGRMPIIGSIVVFPSMGGNGHVAYVTKVLSNTKFTVTEMNYGIHTGMRSNTYDISSSNTDARFIYPRDCMYLDSNTGVLCHDYYEADGSFWWPEDAHNFVLFRRGSNGTLSSDEITSIEGRAYFDAISMGQYPHHRYVDLAEYKGIGDEVVGIGGFGDGIQDEDYHLNHKHAVGMHSVRWQVMTQSDDWIEGDPFRARLGTKQTMNIRVKVEEKEGWTQNSVCIDLYYSHDRWFSRTYDTLLQTKCIGRLEPNDVESAYFENYSLTELDAQTHYLFADIRYDSDHNISSRTDDTEYIEIEIIHSDDAPPVDLIAHSLSLTHPAYTGQVMGLRVGITNIGGADAYSGTRGEYQINTTAGWQTIADDGTDAEQLMAGLTAWEEISDGHGLRAPTTPGFYEYRFCADRPNYLIETDEGNNCVQETFEILQSPLPDFITTGLRLTNGRTWLYGGALYGLQVNVKNIGTVTPSSGIRTSYDIKGPGTGNVWVRVADDGSDANELTPGRSQFEFISDGHGAWIPSMPGFYDARSCADHQNAVAEVDESNNCSYTQFEVVAFQPVYRLYNSKMRSHLYTISKSEKDRVDGWSNWRYERVEFSAYSSSKSGTVPIYRFYRSGKGHLYTRSTSERDRLIANPDWKYEGARFWAFSRQQPGTKAVHRLYSSSRQSHFYCTRWSEVENAKNLGYRYERIEFYAY